MTDWQIFAPLCGWGSFTDSIAVTEALWSRLSPIEWHYLNLTSGSSAWESRQDGSMVRVHYEGERLIEFAVQSGVARESVKLLVSQFGLAPVAPSS